MRWLSDDHICSSAWDGRRVCRSNSTDMCNIRLECICHILSLFTGGHHKTVQSMPRLALYVFVSSRHVIVLPKVHFNTPWIDGPIECSRLVGKIWSFMLSSTFVQVEPSDFHGRRRPPQADFLWNRWLAAQALKPNSSLFMVHQVMKNFHRQCLSSGEHTKSYWTWPIYRWFTY